MGYLLPVGVTLPFSKFSICVSGFRSLEVIYLLPSCLLLREQYMHHFILPHLPFGLLCIVDYTKCFLTAEERF